ncbi:hypothetical protein CALCODRAFT_500788 [Calocera cornea HHB12733]|uniref:DUF4048 domain-containing protein n=1 Tax=Calocera cornea HHB12733 TaxID=1353952 RepID=A0A165DXH1_9BASI|nr:hypothetical protein CALCODRAFT_500788 [Calocera cornea HHB12733]
MNTLVSAPHLTFGTLPSQSHSTSTSTTSQPTSTSPPPGKARLRPLSLLITTPGSPPPSRSSDTGTGSGSAGSTPLGSPNAIGGASTPGRRRANVKRMSSISYSPRRREELSSPASFSAIFPSSATPSSSTPTFAHRSSPSTSSTSTPQPNPLALTLPEKHADLLTFIAQKESRVMDLRRQLTEAEHELRGLKKKWEGIVARSQAGLGAGQGGGSGSGKEGIGSGSGTGSAAGEPRRGKSVQDVLKQGGRIINELVFDSPAGLSSLTSPSAPSATITTTTAGNTTTSAATNAASSPALSLFSPSPAPSKGPTHVQMQPIKKPTPGPRDSISSLSSLSGSSAGTTTTTTTSEDSSAPRSPSLLSAMSSHTIKPLLSTTTTTTTTPSSNSAPASSSESGPTLQALSTTLNRALDGLRSSEAYATHSKRASQLFTSSFSQLSGLGFGLGSFAPSSATTAAGPPAKAGLADYGEGKLTSPTAGRRRSPSSSLPQAGPNPPVVNTQPRAQLSALTLGITAQVSRPPSLSPIPSPASSRISLSSGVNLLDDPLQEPLGTMGTSPVLVPSPVASVRSLAPASTGAPARDPLATALGGPLAPSPAIGGGRLPGVSEESAEAEADDEDAWGW